MYRFVRFNSYRVVVVSGCQRTGTGIMSRIVAHDQAREYVDEEDYGTKAPAEWLNLIKSSSSRIVVHSPAMARFLVDVRGFSDVAVVWMLRGLPAVSRSMRRIVWSDANERVLYNAQSDSRHIYEVKLDFWRKVQRPLFVGRYEEVEYISLRDHPLWVDKRKRSAWDARRWRL